MTFSMPFARLKHFSIFLPFLQRVFRSHFCSKPLYYRDLRICGARFGVFSCKSLLLLNLRFLAYKPHLARIGVFLNV